MVASLKGRHFEIQETDVRRDYFEVVFTKEKDGICKERWHPAATFLPSVCPHSLWRKKLELQPISNQWFLKEDIGTRPGMDGFFDGPFTYLGWNFDKQLSPVRPLWLVFCENLEVRLNHFPFLTDLLWHLEHNGWNSSSASFTQWLAPNPKGPLRSVWLWKNKDKTVCGLIEISERLLQLNVNNN